jgi:hypothetical protein
MTYGYEVHGPDDRILNASKRMLEFGEKKVLPGALLVNYLPFRMKSRLFHDSMDLHTSVRYIPEWVPWLSYKPLARIGYNMGNKVLYPPLQFVKESIVSSYSS